MEEWRLSRIRERFERFVSARGMTRLMPLFLRQIVPVFAIVEASSQRDAVSFLLCGAGTFRVAADLTLTDPPLCKHHCWYRRSSTRPRLLLPRPARRPGWGRLRDGRRAPLASAALVAALTAYSVPSRPASRTSRTLPPRQGTWGPSEVCISRWRAGRRRRSPRGSALCP